MGTDAESELVVNVEVTALLAGTVGGVGGKGMEVFGGIIGSAVVLHVSPLQSCDPAEVGGGCVVGTTPG